LIYLKNYANRSASRPAGITIFPKKNQAPKRETSGKFPVAVVASLHAEI
jgi:hypothetical protein